MTIEIDDGKMDNRLNNFNSNESNETKHSFEDFKELISNLLVIDTFLLGFTLTYGNSISYDDLLSSDQRYMTIWKDNNINQWFGISNQYFILFSKLNSYLCYTFRPHTFLLLRVMISYPTYICIHIYMGTDISFYV